MTISCIGRDIETLILGQTETGVGIEIETGRDRDTTMTDTG